MGDRAGKHVLISHKVGTEPQVHPSLLSEPEKGAFPDLDVPPVVQAPSHSRAGLDFEVAHYFMWGSPLAAFLVLKNTNELVYPSRHWPGNTRLYNVFHRQDPVALRLEPLLFPELRDRVPPPVVLPSFPRNAVPDHLYWRREFEGIASTHSGFRMVTKAFRKLFSNSGPSEAELMNGISWWEYDRYIKSRRCLLPDRLKKVSRYGHMSSNVGNDQGVGRVPAASSPSRVAMGTPPARERAPRAADGDDSMGVGDPSSPGDWESTIVLTASNPPASAGSLHESPDDVPRPVSDTPELRGEVSIFQDVDDTMDTLADCLSSNTPQGSTNRSTVHLEAMELVEEIPPSLPSEQEEDSEQVSSGVVPDAFVVAKGDAKAMKATLMNDPFGLIGRAKLGRRARPFTIRQLALFLGSRIRDTCAKRIAEALADRVVESEVDRRRMTAWKSVETEIEEFYSSVTKTVASKPNPSYLTEEEMSADQGVEWLSRARELDLERSEESARQELRRELDGELSEWEEGGGDELPVRVDYAVSETMTELMIAPLGLLSSHLGYWSCKDTCLFLLKQITDFRPRINKEKRDQIVKRALEARKKCLKKIKSNISQGRR